MPSRDSHCDRYEDPTLDRRYNGPDCETCGICRLYRDERVYVVDGDRAGSVIAEVCIHDVVDDPDGDLKQVRADYEACEYFVRVPDMYSEDEVFLRRTDEVVLDMPVLECSNCGFKSDHYFFYKGPTYAKRIVHWCPSCHLRILGVVGDTNG